MNDNRLPLSLFTRRVLVVMGVVLPTILVAYFLWSIGRGILVVFSGMLFAILLDAIARVIRRYTPIGRNISLLITIIVIGLLGFGGSWLGGSSVAAQAPQLSKQIGQSLDRIHGQLLGSGLTSTSGNNSQADNKNSGAKEVLSYGKKMVGNATKVLSVTVGMVTDTFIILILGIYFAITPQFYVESVAMLVPPSQTDRAINVLNAVGHALRRWFLGRIMAMALTGVLTIAGLYLIGVKLALLLGIIAGLLTFVPYLGAIVSAVPAILVGLVGGTLTAIYVAILFLIVHIVEGYVFTPLVQKRIVHVAPAFLLMAQLFAGLFAGIFGIFVATPIAIALTIAVQKLYIQDMLAEAPHILGDETEDNEAESKADEPHSSQPAS